MALRLEELEGPRGAQIYRFPSPHARPARRPAPRRQAAGALARRRAALGAMVVVVSVALLFAGGPASISTASGRTTPGHVVVAPGETLWSIAHRFAPAGTDPRAYVDAVIALNHLSGMPQAGVRLRLPR